MLKLRPGEDGEPLPGEEVVFRLAIPRTMDGQTLGAQLSLFAHPPFQLSSDDKKESPPRLSVWASSLTTPRQAWEIMGQHPKYQVILRLRVADIRSLSVIDGPLLVPSLDVVWHPRITDSAEGPILDSSPGAFGHSGITNLDPEVYKGNRTPMEQVKSLRRQLAEIADKKPFSSDLVSDEDAQ